MLLKTIYYSVVNGVKVLFVQYIVSFDHDPFLFLLLEFLASITQLAYGSNLPLIQYYEWLYYIILIEITIYSTKHCNFTK